ncbi:MAG: hypothetical protein JXA77_00310 [Bacteroidales bacterium]|nr:hypothetical protein [Bacteroidales bacterium]MBN2821217.1 hypothetical protein [Bacteroidales bacterium]
MGKSPKKNKVYDAFDLIAFAWDKKGILIGVTTLGAIASIIISLLMPEKFKSTVVLFPAASVSISKSLVETSSISMDSRDILSFGREEDAERMLQILNSNKIKEHIVSKFSLFTHYEIDMDPKNFPYTKLDNKYKSNIKYRRTEYQSIEISVLDEDPQYAANMANEIASYIDSTIHGMQKDRALEAYKIVKREYELSQLQIDEFSDSIQKIRSLGIIDYESQAAALNEAYASALSKGDNNAANSIKSRMNILARYGGVYVELSKKLESEIERLGMLKDKYAAAKINVEQTVPQIFIVDSAQVSEQKSEPVRSVIVMISTLSSFAFTLLLLLIIDNVKARSNSKKN